jgi:hypothetical protein
MRTNGPHKTRIITDESQVPDGFVNMRSYSGGDESFRRLMSKWHITGLVPAYKLMRTVDDRTGPVWVCKESVDRALAEAVRLSGEDPVEFAAEEEEMKQQEAATREWRFEETVKAMGGSCTERELTHRNREFAGGVGRELMEAAVRKGWGRWEPVPTSSKGGRPSRRFFLTSYNGATRPQGDANEAVVLLRRIAASLDHLVALWQGKEGTCGSP